MKTKKYAQITMLLLLLFMKQTDRQTDKQTNRQKLFKLLLIIEIY